MSIILYVPIKKTQYDVNGYDGETGLFARGFGYLPLTGVTNIASEKGIYVANVDNLQYSRGSKTQNNESVVYESFSPHQGSLEFWVRPNFASTEANDHYIFDIDTANLFWDGSETKWTAIINGITITSSDTFTAGSWIYILVTWEEDTPTLDLTVDATAEAQVTSAQTIGTIDSNIFIGQDQNGANVFDGVISGRVLNRIITSSYNSGSGLLNTFTVDPETVWMGIYSDDDTDAVFQHRGQSVSALTTTVATLGEAVGSRSWADNDRVVVYDGTGYKKEALINDAGIESTDTTITVDDGAGGVVTDLDKVGLSLDFNAAYNAQAANNTVHQITTQDIGISAWVRIDIGSTGIDYVLKKYTATAGYEFYVEAGIITLNIGDGIDTYKITGDTDIRDNKWHHITGVIDKSNATNCKISLDGYEDGTTNKTGTLGDVGSLTNTDTLDISDSNSFDGQIRDVILAYPADIMAANEMGASGEILTLATNPRDFTTVNHEDAWALYDNAADATVAATGTGSANGGAGFDLIASANTNTFSTQEAFISKNLIPDAGMENGGIGGWIIGAHGTKIESYEKSSSAKFDGQSLYILTTSDLAWSSIYQQVALTENEEYLINAWIKGDNTTYSSLSINTGVDQSAGVITTFFPSVADSWDFLESSFTAGATNYVHLRERLQSNQDYFDQLQLLPNLVDNGGMEGAKQGGDPYYPAGSWTQQGSPGAGEVDVSTNADHSGTLGLELVNADDGEGVTQDVTVVSGKWYTFSAWAKNNNQDTEILLSDAITKTIDTTTAGNTWTKFSYTFKAASTTLTVKLVSGATNQSGYFDDVALIALDQLDASTATPSSLDNSFETGQWSDANGALLLDGGDTLKVDSTNNISATASTFAIWIKPEVTGIDRTLISVYTGAGDYLSLGVDASDNPYADIDGVTVTGTTSLVKGTWYQIVCTWTNGGNLILYVNGTAEGTPVGYASVTVPTYIEIGSKNSANQSYGTLDDIRIYDVVLTSTQISDLYSATTVTNTSSTTSSNAITAANPDQYVYIGNDNNLKKPANGLLDDVSIYSVLDDSFTAEDSAHNRHLFRAMDYLNDYLLAHFLLDGSGNLVQSDNHGCCRQLTLVSSSYTQGSKTFAFTKNADEVFQSSDRICIWSSGSTNAYYDTISSVTSTTVVVSTGGALTLTGTIYVSRNLLAEFDMELANTSYWTASGSTLAVETTTIKQDVRSLKVTNTGAANGLARQTVTVVSGQCYKVSGMFYPPSTPNGASYVISCDLDADKSITVTQSNLTSSVWNYVELVFQADDVSVTVDFSVGSVTDTEFSYWDAVRMIQMDGGISNAGMEDL